MLGKVWTDTDAVVIKKGFEKTGIMPFNRNAISDTSFDPNKLQRFKSVINAPSAEVSPQNPKENEINWSQMIKTQQQILQQLNEIQKPTSASPLATTKENNTTFETLLLRTVTPRIHEKQSKKRTDTAEIITNEKYLQILKDNNNVKVRANVKNKPQKRCASMNDEPKNDVRKRARVTLLSTKL